LTGNLGFFGSKGMTLSRPMIESRVFVERGGVTVDVTGGVLRVVSAVRGVESVRAVVSGATTAVAALTVSMDGSVSVLARSSGGAQPIVATVTRIVNRLI
jgi:hypothetical protein